MAVLHSVGSDLRPRAHVHVIATDGVFVPAAHGPASFVPLTRPFESRELRELARVVRSEARSVEPSPDPGPHPASGARIVREPSGREPRGTVTQARGAEVFVGERIEAHDRKASESLTAYVLRPPLHPASVSAVGDDVVELKLRDPGDDGASVVRLPKPAFEARVRAMTGEQGVPRMTLHGALAPGSSVRWRGEGKQLSLVDAAPVERRRSKARGAERCRCGGRLEVVAAEPVTDPDES